MSQTVTQTGIFHRSLNKNYGLASGGDGVYLLHPDGSRTLDGSSGAAVSCLRHGHRAVIDAIVQQAQSMAFAHTSFFSSDPAEKLASFLIKQSDNAFTKVMFLSSGSEAVESAIKLARQFFVAKGEPQRVNFLCRKYGYHGNTLGALSAGWNPQRRQTFEPLLSPAFHHVSPCFYSRDGGAGEPEEQYMSRLIEEYEELFQTLGTSSVAAILIETVGGATLGAVPPAKGYLQRLRSLCDKYGALLILDEVMCGMGRMGTVHAWQSYGNTIPDLQTIGKGLGAGYQPISAILVGAKVHKTLQASEPGLPFVSGHTYQGHSIGCAAALATQQTIMKDNLLANVMAMGDLLSAELRKQVPLLKEVRGRGLFQAVEFATLPHIKSLAGDVSRTSLANGLAIYLCSSAVDCVLFAPPFTIREREVYEMVDIFVRSTKQVIEQRGLKI
ncbi:hypothetical protein LTR56_015917 [Elasticomyces elasticus]|nr:hypothetical protein LTR56_015917 [Elasticomyces elasticus]KAK3655326.1 hypothetical protein LTR22_010356 [Elasticomyces elasticus]KAK4918682.1 hypothetical protein LTR49_013607 [Elasticomyces elasticus]KAK5751974.1 hypothetical protein LTS12_017990 [Elasticomyces elasticus]